MPNLDIIRQCLDELLITPQIFFDPSFAFAGRGSILCCMDRTVPNLPFSALEINVCFIFQLHCSIWDEDNNSNVTAVERCVVVTAIYHFPLWALFRRHGFYRKSGYHFTAQMTHSASASQISAQSGSAWLNDWWFNKVPGPFFAEDDSVPPCSPQSWVDRAVA